MIPRLYPPRRLENQMAVTISKKVTPANWAPGDPVPEGYIVTKHHKLMKKPPGKPKGTISIRRREKLKAEEAMNKKAERSAHEAAVLARKIVDANSLHDDEIAAEARRLLDMDKPKKYEESMERRTSLLAMAYKLQIRGLNEDQISQQLQMSVTSVRHLLEEVHAQTRLDPKKLDIGFYMGESLSFFTEIRQMALLLSADGKASRGEKLGAMRTALDAEHRKNEFLTKIGMYSPTILQTVERWVVGTADAMTAPPQVRERVNLAAEVGKALARRRLHVDAEDVAPRSAE
jgi:hypothetical protein